MNEWKKNRKKTLIVFEANYKQRIAAENIYNLQIYAQIISLVECLNEWMNERVIHWFWHMFCLFVWIWTEQKQNRRTKNREERKLSD